MKNHCIIFVKYAHIQCTNIAIVHHIRHSISWIMKEMPKGNYLI